VSAFILLALLLLSLLGHLTSFVGGVISGTGAAGAGLPLREVVVESSAARDKIAIVDVEGLIFGGYLAPGDGSMVAVVAEQLRRAKQDARVKAVILRVNSPGGEVLASDEIARAVREFQETSGKPVVASLDGIAASGGYYVAVPARWIVASEMTLTGSIGVIMHAYNYRGLLDKVGIRPEVLKSGRFKDMLRGDKAEAEITPEEKSMLQAMIDQTYEQFASVVREGRGRAARENAGAGRALSPQWKDLADGRILTGTQAYEHGFVDELGNFQTAVNRARQLVGLTSANLVKYKLPPRLFDLGSLLGRASTQTVKLDVGLDLPRLKAGLPYFLYLPTVP
jgi:protease-4